MGTSKQRSQLGSPTLLTNEDLAVDVEMIDDDNMHGVESQFHDNACICEGVSGSKPIDTLYENTSEDKIDAPRSARMDVPIKGKMPNHEGTDNPAPVCTNEYMYPHRRY